MDIGEIINKITEAILHFDLKKFLQGSKVAVLTIAAIGLALILFGLLYSLIPQF